MSKAEEEGNKRLAAVASAQQRGEVTGTIRGHTRSIAVCVKIHGWSSGLTEHVEALRRQYTDKRFDPELRDALSDHGLKMPKLAARIDPTVSPTSEVCSAPDASTQDDEIPFEDDP